MSVESFEGIVENGLIRLPEHLSLPDKTKVFIVVPNEASSVAKIPSPHLVDPSRIVDFEKKIIDENTDASL